MTVAGVGQSYLGARVSINEADIVLAGVPFDLTAAFRPGARFGPGSIRVWSEVLETYSPEFERDLEDLALSDAGDLPLPHDWEGSSAMIRDWVGGMMRQAKTPLLLGGEHLVTLPAVEASFMEHGELAVLQIDAHMDLRDEYRGLVFSHATVMRRVLERVGPRGLLQYGVRSGTRAEWELSGKEGLLYADPDSLPEAIGGRPLYLSVDLDVLDPSIMPETGAPEPGGLSFAELLEVLSALRGSRVVAGDVVEYCPLPAGGGPSGAVAAKVVREMIFLMAEARKDSGSG